MSEIDDALEKLGQAHGADALQSAFQRLAATIRRDRRRQGAELGVLASTITEALRHRDLQRAAGAAPEELASNFEKTIRASWPFTREWHYLCEACGDTGWRRIVCAKGARCNGVSTRTDFPNQAPGKYRRLCAQAPDSDYTHDYVEACWCARGEAFRPKVHTDVDRDEAAAKVRKPSRFGR